MFNNQPVPSFDVSRAITTHIEQRIRLDNYINGKSQQLPDPELTSCNAGCLFAKWLHQQGCKGFKDFHLLNQICNTCEEFQTAAFEAVLLVKIGKVELAGEVLQGGGIYAEASAEFQRNLAQLHCQLVAGSTRP